MRFAAALLALVASAAVPALVSAVPVLAGDPPAPAALGEISLPKGFATFRGYLLWACAQHIELASWVMNHAAQNLVGCAGAATCVVRKDGGTSPLDLFYSAALRIDPHLSGPAQADDASVRGWLLSLSKEWSTGLHDLVLKARAEEVSSVADLLRLRFALLDAAVRALASLPAEDPFESHGRTLDAILAEENLFDVVYEQVLLPKGPWTEDHARLCDGLLEYREHEQATLAAYRPDPLTLGLVYG